MRLLTLIRLRTLILVYPDWHRKTAFLLILLTRCCIFLWSINSKANIIFFWNQRKSRRCTRLHKNVIASCIILQGFRVLKILKKILKWYLSGYLVSYVIDLKLFPILRATLFHNDTTLTKTHFFIHTTWQTAKLININAVHFYNWKTIVWRNSCNEAEV